MTPPRNKPAGKRPNLGGRPVTIHADRRLDIMVDAATLDRLAQLAAAWQCSKAAAVRRAIEQAR